MGIIRFPRNFVWGAATSSYQIEGAHDADKKGLSIWDTFSHTKGKISDSTNGDVACDHFHRYRDDIAIMKQLGLGAYRFSLSWPRIMPDGVHVNEKGFCFYDRLIDGLLEKNIRPFATLYHWDLPQVLCDAGGWYSRETAKRFADYAQAVVSRYHDRVGMWMTLNEPMVSFVCGYFSGEHAPGKKFSFKAFKVPHNLLLAHGYAVQSIRSVNSSLKVGLVNAIPFTDAHTPKDTKAVRKDEGFGPFLFMDPVYKGHYPKEVEKLFHFFNRDIRDGDFDIISQPTDFLGINHYSRDIVKRSIIPVPGFSPVKPSYKGVQFTDVGWEVYPQGMYEVLMRVHRDYQPKEIYVTENGAAYDDPVIKGCVHDERRVSYMKSYCEMMKKAMDDGVPVKGYFAWSLLDNFEWAHGYTKRFGIVHVDFKTQKRTLKDSALWYRDTIAQNGFDLPTL